MICVNKIDCENVWRQIDTSIVDISNEFEYIGSV